jgi:hypothetical protein
LAGPDPKKKPRIGDRRSIRVVDPGVLRAVLLTDRECRAGCGSTASEGHHLLFRSQGGDDVAANVVPVCTDCHAALHSGVRVGLDGRRRTARIVRCAIAANLRPENRAYLDEKLGGPDRTVEFLGRVYYANEP